MTTIKPGFWMKLCKGRVFQRFWRDGRGSIAVNFAIAMIPILITTGAAVDLARMMIVRQRVEAALDAAGLAIGATLGLTDEQAKAMAQQFFDANYPASALGTPDPINVTISGQTITMSATASVNTTLLGFIGIDKIDVDVSSEIIRSMRNIEVAVALDVTGSMSGSKIDDLKVAAKELVKMVVLDAQEPYYSKVALAPYSAAVNPGAFADEVRGQVAQGIAISNATQTSPVVVTANGHGYANGDFVWISGVSGMTQINNSSSNYPTGFKVKNVTANTFALTDPSGNNINGKSFKKYSSGSGTAYCTKYGCQFLRFTNAQGNKKVLPVSTCATERTGADAYSDLAAATSNLGKHYAPSGNPCLADTIEPLTSNKTILNGKIDGLQIGGSTAGHLGTAWTGYLLSPAFGVWSGSSAPGPYDDDDYLKAAVVMTDGVYNTAYCSGVISKDAGSGSGSSSDHINCNATNGPSADQALSYCSALKSKGIMVFTVGYDMDANPDAKDLLQSCASETKYFCDAPTGSELKVCFQAIAQAITNLRVSK